MAYRGAAVLVGAGTLAAGLALVPTAHAKAPSVDYDKLRADIVAIMEAEDKRRGDGTGIGPTFVRLAWHASGTYSKVDGTGGSNGATMRFCPEGQCGVWVWMACSTDPSHRLMASLVTKLLHTNQATGARTRACALPAGCWSRSRPSTLASPMATSGRSPPR